MQHDYIDMGFYLYGIPGLVDPNGTPTNQPLVPDAEIMGYVINHRVVSGGGMSTGTPSAFSLRGTSYSVDVAVPEPTTWALMIAGFGLAGATLRRHRRQALAA
ncbi:MAG: hypothetical protein DI570_09965 [Phenylobacterium zucineum]|nr:MAG: hypothetical protein DI570_09965 [Phenylobacterium zucineum]